MSETTAITIAPAARAALALNSSKIETELRELATSSADITAVIDKAGREQAHRIGMVLRTRRTEITKAGKDARDDATKFSKAVIAEEDRLIGIIQPEETRVLTLRDGWDAEQERIEAERVAKERARMAAHEANITKIVAMPAYWANCSSKEIMDIRDHLVRDAIGEEWEEYKDRAVAAKDQALTQLADLHAALAAREEAARVDAETREAERVRAAAEAEALASQRAEQQAEAKRLAEQQEAMRRQQVEIDAKARADELERQQRVAVEEAQRKAAADAHAAEMKRQADELAAQRAAFEAEQKAARDAAAAAIELAITTSPETTAAAIEVGKAMQDAIVTGTGVLSIADGDITHVAAASIVAVPQTLRLGQINERLGLGLNADMLLKLGFAPAATDKSAKLFHESDFSNICAAIQRHAEAVAKQFAVEP